MLYTPKTTIYTPKYIRRRHNPSYKSSSSSSSSLSSLFYIQHSVKRSISSASASSSSSSSSLLFSSSQYYHHKHHLKNNNVSYASYASSPHTNTTSTSTTNNILLSAANLTFPCWRPSPGLLDTVRSVPGIQPALEEWNEEPLDSLLEHTNVERVEMPYGNYAYVYGSYHSGASPMFKRFVALTRAVRPDTIVLEMCSERLPSDGRKVRLKNISEQGGDMLTAVAAAGEVGAQVCLGDRPKSITDSRLNRSTSVQDKIRMRFHQEDHYILTRPKTGSVVYEILTRERNSILAAALMSAAKHAASQGKDVMGIIGQSHMEGVLDQLQSEGEQLLSKDLSDLYRKTKVNLKRPRTFKEKYLSFILFTALIIAFVIALQFVK